MYEYHGKISVKFKKLPSIQLKTIKTKNNHNIITRLAMATKRRFFTLDSDWVIELDNIKYNNDLNGEIIITKKNDVGSAIEFDGASVPLPWLVSLLTIGILRPLGVMLIASIVHDYAYKTGKLYKKTASGKQAIEIERRVADLLLRDIISTVNNLSIVGYIAWFFIRLGWLWPPIKCQCKTTIRNWPFIEYGASALVIIGLYHLFKHLSITFSEVFFACLWIYLGFYVISILMIKCEK